MLFFCEFFTLRFILIRQTISCIGWFSLTFLCILIIIRVALRVQGWIRKLCRERSPVKRMNLDVAALSMNMAQIQTMNSFGVAMLDKNLDMMKEAGAAMVDMMDNSMELSVNPNIGSNFDLRV